MSMAPIIFLLAILGLALASIAFRRALTYAMSGRRARLATREEQVRLGALCPCGYDLTKIDLPRCPECGRVVGFEADPETLGLTPEEQARLAEVRRRRATDAAAESDALVRRAQPRAKQ